MQTSAEATSSIDKETPSVKQESIRSFAPHPPSQYDQNLSYEEWMTESIGFFRGVGFFDEFRGLDDFQVLQRLHQKREKEIRETWARLIDEDVLEDQWVVTVKTDLGESTHYHNDPESFPGSIRHSDYLQQEREKAMNGVSFDRKDDLADIWIAREDKTRVWYSDLEAGAYPESDDYVQALTEWGRISRGIFEPKEIRETWKPVNQHEYRLQISFQWNGTPHSIEFDTVDEWINLKALNAINELIRDSGTRFYVYESFDQCAYIVALTAKERAAIEQKRSWKFSSGIGN
jgi:hypothetical protein